MHKRANIVTIAKLSGFSTSTVSRVLNGLGPKFRISEATCKKILDIAQEMNYTPSLVAQSLRLKKTNAIGLIVPDIANPYFANLAKIITNVSRKRGYSIILSDSEDNVDTEKKLMSVLVDRNIDAVIMAPCSNVRDHIDEAITSGIKVMLVDRYFEESNIPFVTTDNYRGAFDATKHLLDNGHIKIACIQGYTDTVPNQQRVQGFIDACKSNDMDEKYIIVGNSFSIQNGYLETKLLLSSNNGSVPTAILCLSSMTLLGVCKALKEANLSIPEDVSVITFDNQPFMDYLDPPITSIAQPVEDIGTVSIKVLIDKLEDDNTDMDLSVKLRPQIIYRDSVKPI